MKTWVDEILYGSYKQSFSVVKHLYSETSRYQKIEIFENEIFGRILILDDIIQTTERDNFVYHEMMTHVPLLSHENPKQVLIIGGGDGGILREVVKHSVEVTMVEIDRSVVNACKQFMPSISNGAFEHKNATLIIGDGVDFVKNTHKKFDVIIVDSTDPIGPSIPLFGDEFYSNCKNILTENGIMVNQSGVSFLQDEEATDTYQRMGRFFKHSSLYIAQVPTYCAGFMTIGWGTDDVKAHVRPLNYLTERYEELSLNTEYYNPGIHLSCFTLPNYIEALKRD